MSDEPRACCAPARTSGGGDRTTGRAPASVRAPASGGRTPERRWSGLDGGAFLMGSEDSPYPADGEGPVREVRVEPFGIAATAVTNAEFAAFAGATGHRTDAERFGWSFVFAGFLPGGFPPTRGAVEAPWWRQVYDADWRRPEGPDSSVADRGGHPVVHVSYADAVAYCEWAGPCVRLPAEAEWEYAARGGLAGRPYPWGDEREPDGAYRMNIWRGSFPDGNTAADGYAGTCPVDAFAPNGYGLFNMTGNVWEWCADRFGDAGDGTRALRGGSYLCHESYCLRYRTSARMGNTPDSSSGNTGFRVARAASG